VKKAAASQKKSTPAKKTAAASKPAAKKAAPKPAPKASKAAAPPKAKAKAAKPAAKPVPAAKAATKPAAKATKPAPKAVAAKPAPKAAKPAPKKPEKKAAKPTPAKAAPAKSAPVKPAAAKKTKSAPAPTPSRSQASAPVTKKNEVKPAPTPVKPSAKAPVKAAPEPEKPSRAEAPSKPRKTAKVVAADKGDSDPPKRSHHLQKLLALREKTHKVRKVGEGLPTAVKKAEEAAAAAVAAAAAAEEKAKAKAARNRKPNYTKAELAELRAMLEDERERLLNDLRQLDDLADSNRQTTHATFSSHQADAASDSSALESTYIQRRYEEERFAMVSEALLKLEAGTYGLCELCADEPQGKCATCPFISIERLKAKPFAKMCVQLRAEMEKKNRR